MHINIEFKARCVNPNTIRATLKERGADYVGEDHQVDVYFKVPNGRLKLRKGSIENHLIYYERPDQAGPKKSDITLFINQPGPSLESLLTNALGVLTTVDKRREIYFIANVKFHIDQVQGLGSFVEVEAIDKDGTIGPDKLWGQCNQYLNLLGIPESALISQSYSDLILAKTR